MRITDWVKTSESSEIENRPVNFWLVECTIIKMFPVGVQSDMSIVFGWAPFSAIVRYDVT